jgi:DNA transformation protein
MENNNPEVSQLQGLGEKSAKCLNGIGIYKRSDLEKTGVVNVFMDLKEEGSIKPSLNFLYAMVGALENKHWAKIAKEEKGRLLMELEGYKELEKIFNDG